MYPYYYNILPNTQFFKLSLKIKIEIIYMAWININIVFS
jgi:hypothetical protein